MCIIKNNQASRMHNQMIVDENHLDVIKHKHGKLNHIIYKKRKKGIG